MSRHRIGRQVVPGLLLACAVSGCASSEPRLAVAVVLEDGTTIREEAPGAGPLVEVRCRARLGVRQIVIEQLNDDWWNLKWEGSGRQQQAFLAYYASGLDGRDAPFVRATSIPPQGVAFDASAGLGASVWNMPARPGYPALVILPAKGWLIQDL